MLMLPLTKSLSTTETTCQRSNDLCSLKPSGKTSWWSRLSFTKSRQKNSIRENTLKSSNWVEKLMAMMKACKRLKGQDSSKLLSQVLKICRQKMMINNNLRRNLRIPLGMISKEGWQQQISSDRIWIKKGLQLTSKLKLSRPYISIIKMWFRQEKIARRKTSKEVDSWWI